MKKISVPKKLYLFLMLLFLYAPIGTLMVLSFNESKSRSHWDGFTFDWYISLFQNEYIMSAFENTIMIAFLSSVIATVIGVAAATGMQFMKPWMKRAVIGITNIPMLNADIVTGISLMLLFIACRVSMGFMSVLIAHITFNIPYVIVSVLPRFANLDRSQFEAALDLGATPGFAFRKIVIPDLMPGIWSGFLMSFTMSLDDFIITHFTQGAGFNTLSTKIYSELKKGINPEIYALSTILFAFVLLLLFLLNRKRPADNDRRQGKHVIRKGLPAVASFLVIMIISVITLTSCGNAPSYHDENTLFVYNWGEYLDPDIIEDFMDETGIEVVYDEFETNEVMYPISSGNSDFFTVPLKTYP